MSTSDSSNDVRQDGEPFRERISAVERNEQRRACRCVHFTGIGNNVCKAGVVYDSFERGKSLPCILKMQHLGEQNVCAKYEKPTAESLAKEDRAWDKMYGDMMKARKAITDLAGKRRGVLGKLPCPVCASGNLSYSISGYNGHIHATCSTRDCVAWME